MFRGEGDTEPWNQERKKKKNNGGRDGCRGSPTHEREKPVVAVKNHLNSKTRKPTKALSSV